VLRVPAARGPAQFLIISTRLWAMPARQPSYRISLGVTPRWAYGSLGLFDTTLALQDQPIRILEWHEQPAGLTTMHIVVCGVPRR
jgi:hypothetical protein